MATTTATPKIVGKAIYLELVADPTQDPDLVRRLLGWQSEGTKQVIIFPQYQDDTGKIHDPVIMSRVVSRYSPKAQWDFSAVRNNLKSTYTESEGSEWRSYDSYSPSEFDKLTDREKHEVRNRDLEKTLRRILLDTYYENDITKAGQGWVVRDNTPIVVEVTDQDRENLRSYTTPQAVIRRINKVRDSISTFPTKLV